MSLVYSVVTYSIKGITRILCNVDDAQLSSVPAHGPLILACNHINFIEVPLLFTHLQPRPVTGFAKAETWDNPVMAFLFNLWGAIPIQRGEADMGALRRALEVLKEGKILAIAPEGTRSGHGKLKSGHPGIVMLALWSDTPILPLVYFGGEGIRENLNHLKRTDFHIRVGKLFRLHALDSKVDRDIRKRMLEEIMYQMAGLLPEAYRGCYSDLSKTTTNFIDFV